MLTWTFVGRRVLGDQVGPGRGARFGRVGEDRLDFVRAQLLQVDGAGAAGDRSDRVDLAFELAVDEEGEFAFRHRQRFGLGDAFRGDGLGLGDRVVPGHFVRDQRVLAEAVADGGVKFRRGGDRRFGRRDDGRGGSGGGGQGRSRGGGRGRERRGGRLRRRRRNLPAASDNLGPAMLAHPLQGRRTCSPPCSEGWAAAGRRELFAGLRIPLRASPPAPRWRRARIAHRRRTLSFC